MKRIISLVLSIVIILCVFSALEITPNAASSKASSSESFSWNVNNGTLNISGNGEIEDYNFYTSTPWYKSSNEITKIIISEGITKIGNNAFKNCKSLESVHIPGSVKSIGDNSFQRCEALKELNIGNGVESIGILAFQYCENLENVTVPDSVKRISDYAFEGCYKLSDVKLGSGLIILGNNPFADCRALSTITLNENNNNIKVIDNVLFDSDDGLVCYPISKGGEEYTIPDGTTLIYGKAFQGCKNLYRITMPDTVTSIKEDAFRDCQLTKISLSKNLKEISKNAFRECNIIDIEIPDTVTCIGEDAFRLNNFSGNVFIPKNVKSIGEGAFSKCKHLSSITVDSDNQYYKSVDGILFDKSGQTLLQYPCNKLDSEYTIPDTVTRIGNDAFCENNNITSVKFPEKLKEIGINAFQFCENLTGNLVIPDATTTIDSGVFEYNKNLNSVTLGKNLNSISLFAFAHCDNLKEVYFKGNHPGFWYSPFDGNTMTIYYPNGDETWDNYSPGETYNGITWQTWNTPVVLNTNIPITECSFSLSESQFTYNGKAIRPVVTVTRRGETLENGVDYEVLYSNNIVPGNASVTVNGIGRYKDSKEISFEIYKAKHTLNASLESPSITVGSTTQIITKGLGKISYGTSNPNIATVDQNGVVTAKNAGTTDIYVTDEGDDCYYSDVQSLTIEITEKPKALELNDISYSFSNSTSGFHYPSPYKIPLNIYKILFDDTMAGYLYNNHGNWCGNCYGMSTSSMMFNVKDSSLQLNSFNSSAKKVGDLKYNDKSSSLDLTVTQLNETMLNLQNVSSVATAEYNNREDFAGLISEVKKCSNGAPAVPIGFIGEYGHEVLGYKYEKQSNTNERIYIYDCNYPFENKYITFTKNSNGKYIDWNYGIYGYDSHQMDYCTFDVIDAAWQNRRSHKDSDLSTMLVKNSDTFDILDNTGKTLATMKNGTFTSYDKKIFNSDSCEIQTQGYTIYLPNNMYTVVNKEDSNKKLDVTMNDNDQSVSVSTESDSVKVFVDDTQAANIANVDGECGEKYKVQLNSKLDYSNGAEKIVYSGKYSSDEISVGTSYGDIVASNYTDNGIDVNDDTINILHESDTDISGFDAKLSDTNFVYNGNDICPNVTITNDKGYRLAYGTDYTVVYAGNNTSGTATAIVYGINKYKGCIELNYTIKPLDLSSYSATLSQTSYQYDGFAKKPLVVVNSGSKYLTENVDYSIEYLNNINAGKATVKISGLGGYTGTLSKTFTISDDSAPSTQPSTPAATNTPANKPTTTSPNSDDPAPSTQPSIPAATNTPANKPTTSSPKTKVSFYESSDTIYRKNKDIYYVYLSNSKGKTTFRSSNSKVASVKKQNNELVTVYAKKAGTAKIYAKNNGVQDYIKIKVKNPYLNVKKKNIKIGKTYKLKITGKVGKAKFKSSNKKVATVSKLGKIKAKKKGKATITVTTNGIKLKCKVTVKK